MQNEKMASKKFWLVYTSKSKLKKKLCPKWHKRAIELGYMCQAEWVFQIFLCQCR